MRLLVSEIFRVYKKAPLRILSIWLMDLFEALIIVANPYVIGKCIDGLLQQDIVWLIVLVVLEVLFGISRTLNKLLDTRVYSRIVKEESISYYSWTSSTGAVDSLINARLDLVNDIPNFLEMNLFQILNMILGIIISLIFLYSESKICVFWAAISTVIFIPRITYPFQSKITYNYQEYKTLDEQRVDTISSRNITIYSNFVQKILDIEIQNSDLDAKIFILTHLLQTALLVFAIWSIFSAENFTTGLLFSTITYVRMLNSHTIEVNDNIILLKDLKETAERLKK
ncbi:MAG: hypothetical protein KHZ05_09645 [Oscillospiraceae bacterium]|nr:hypothetical protein [Oscillospiraceae bacterium]